MINTITIEGKLTRDVDIREYGNGAGTINRLSIAHNKPKKDRNGEWSREAHYFNVTAFNLKDVQCSFLTKGAEVVISGELQQNRYKNKDGQEVSTVQILARDIKVTASTKKKDVSVVQPEYQEGEVPF